MRRRIEKVLRETTHQGPDEDFDGNETSDDFARLPPAEEPDDLGDLDEIDPDDERWDAFIADDDERDPQPDYGDFWPED